MDLSSSEVVTINNQPAVHLGSIRAPGTNDFISIVIPLSQAAMVIKEEPLEIKQEPLAVEEEGSKDFPQLPEFPVKLEPMEQDIEEPEKIEKVEKPQKLKENKSKGNLGCPFETCSRYSKPFSRAHDLKRHIIRHETRNGRESEKILHCDICKERFYDAASLQKHKESHVNTNFKTDVLNVPFSTTICQACKESFDSITELQAHLETHIKALATQPENQIKQEIEEDEADDDFNIDEMLLIPKKKAHKETSTSIHTDENSYRCQYCFKVFKTRWTLSSHVAVHEGRFQHECSLCHKRFVRKSHYECHVRSHETARPFTCDHCGKSFKEIKHRREHIKRKHLDISNRSAIQSLFDSISESVSDELNSPNELLDS